MPNDVILPSGLAGFIRELGIEEENVLTNPKLTRSGKGLHRVFKNCWIETTNPGIYDFGDKGFEPMKLLQGDGVVLLVNLRILSYGAEFVFDINCPICGDKIPWELDLREYLEENIRPLPEKSKEIIREKQGLFDCVLPKSNRKMDFHLLTLKEELQFPRVRRDSADKMSSAVLDLSIVRIEGAENDKARRVFLGLDPIPDKWDGSREVIVSADANYFRQELEEVNCGLETTFGVECPMHGEVSVELPFREGFLLPRRKRR